VAEDAAHLDGGAVRQIPVPSSAQALSELPRVDYADAFVVDPAPTDRLTAEQWARTALEQAPAGVRQMLRAGWLALGLKLDAAPAERSVLGWEIRRSTPELVLLGADSRLGLAGELLFRREPRSFLFCTFVHQENQLGRVTWTGVEATHVGIVRRVLKQGIERCSR
jgi:hypothetical protein